jgi:hypothetical protein
VSRHGASGHGHGASGHVTAHAGRAPRPVRVAAVKMCAASRRQEQPPLLRRGLRAVRALLPRIGLNAHVSLRYQMLTKTALPLLRGGPRASAPSQHKALWNHPSWESDDDALWALGPVMVKLPASGVLECVA